MMRIALDIPRLANNPHGGQLYLESFLQALSNETAVESYKFSVRTNGLRGIGAHIDRIKALGLGDQFKLSVNPAPDRLIAKIKRIEPQKFFPTTNRFDTTHVFGSRWMSVGAPNMILTLQDVIELREGGTNRSYVADCLRTLASQCQALITISEFSRREICDSLQAEPSRIHVIPNGLDHSLYRLPSLEERAQNSLTLQELKLAKQPYVLFLGGEAPRKNLRRLLQAFDQLKRRNVIEEKLVIVGISRPSQEISNYIAALNIGDHVIFLGYLSNQNVIRVLQEAKLLVFPSTYEGFGLPPLEAMACGVPVAVSNAASMPEVVGDAGFYFDPYEIDDMCEVLQNALTNMPLRTQKSATGLQKCLNYSWSDNVQKTLSLYSYK